MCREICVFFLLYLWAGAYKIEVKVKQGKIAGQREATVFENRLYFAFYGIPYAQPPIGKLRFKNPKPPEKWKGTFDGTTPYHGTCAQTHIVHKHALFGVEDCLYLNIFTPHIPKTENENLIPVLVWIHGYAFSSCFSNLHGPDFLVNKDVILVTLAHRIGPFGFLKLNDTDSHANMGLKDIVMALKWIRSNIKHFGGAKNKITLMASGSAATFVSLLMTTKASKLFSQLILQSGSMFSPSIFQGDPQSERNKLQQELRRKHLKLETAPFKDIVLAAHDLYIRNNKEMENLQRPIVPFTPMIEPNLNTSLLVLTPKEYYDSIKGKELFLKKPILLGYNSQESISEVMPFIHNPYYVKTFISLFKYTVPFMDGCSYNTSTSTYKQVSKLIKDRYFKGTDTEKMLKDLLKYASDLLTYPIIKFLKTHLGVSKSKMYMYKFDYRGHLNAVKATSIAEKKIKVSGVASGDELCYIFKCEPLWENYKHLIKANNSTDKSFIQDISLLWANFIKFGNPTPQDVKNVTWLPVNSKMNNVLLIKKYFQLVGSKAENAMYGFWDLIYDSYYKKENCNRKHDEL